MVKKRNCFVKALRIATFASSALMVVLIAATIVPVYNRTDSASATAGTPTASTLTFTSTNPVASVSLAMGSPTGTFATSSSSEKAAFSISTNNYTGYTLTMTSTGSNTTLTDGSSHNISTISSSTTEAIFSSSDAAGQALNNRWGYIPNYYNSTANTTNYYPAPTSVNAATLRATSSANGANGVDNADDYTIGLGFRADYNSPSGTYANDSFIMNFVANPISYKITFNDNSGDSTVSGLPGVINSAASEASITLPSTEPTRTGYTFRAWCLGEASSYANVCTGTEFEKGSEFGLDQTANNTNIQLYAVWTGNEYTATIYYNDKTSAGALGTTNIASTTASCKVTDNSNSCSPEVPSVVTASVGTYNNAYKGLATTTGTMTTSSTITLNGASADRYAVYGGNTGGTSKVTIYKPSSTSAATSVTLYRNQWFTSKTAMSSTVLSNSETGTSNWSYSFSVTDPTYSLYGFNTATNSTSRVSTCGAAGTTACSSIANLAMSNITTAYAVERVSVSATFYYNNNTTTTSCTTANVTSATNSAYRYLYTTSTTTATVQNNNISVPSAVSSSKGTCGMNYRNVGTSTSNMTAAAPSTSTLNGVYYARYSGSITNNYYTGSAYTSRTIYRNQRVSGTATDSMSAIVLSTSGTGTSDYSTATGPGSSVWTGLATSSTTTPDYTTVAAAATANAVYTTLYTIYQFNVSYSTTGSTGVSSIGTSTGSGISYCRVNATSTTAGGTSCSVTTPSITVSTGYTSLGWGIQGHTAAGTAAGSSYTLTSTGSTLYANAKINQYTCTKRYRLQNADGTWGSYTADGTSQVDYGATCSYSKTVTDYKNTASGTNNAQASTTCTITTSGCTASLSFYRNTFGLTVNRNTTYISSASATTTAVHTTSNVPYYRWGQAVAITATASTGNEFTSWTQSGTAGTFADANSASTTFTMGKGAATVTAGGRISCSNSFAISFKTSNANSIVLNGVPYTNNQSACLAPGTYHIYGNYATRYAFSSWATTAGTFENQSYQNTAYTVTGNATITLTGQQATLAMQNLSASNCTTTARPVYDNRDNAVYWIQKLPDNKCWMLDNLRLDLTSSAIVNALSVANTNLDTTALGYFKNGGGTESDRYPVAAYTSFNSDTGITDTPRTDVSSKDITLRPSAAADYTGSIAGAHGLGQGKSGAFYNYCAATVGYYCFTSGVGDNSYDACPAGWRMPTGGPSGEYDVLKQLGSNETFVNILSIPLSGFAYGSNHNQVGEFGYIWSSSFNNNYKVYDVTVRSSTTGISVYFNGEERHYGNPVRCILNS